jgi:hypothetical protein
VPQHPLDDLGVRARGEPEGSRRVPEVVNADAGNTGRRFGGPPANRALPVRLAQRPTSRSGPPRGAANSQEPGALPMLHRSTIGTKAGTSGTVRARLFFSVSSYRGPPPLLARTARVSRTPGPGTDTRSPTWRPASSPQRSLASARTGTTSRYGPVHAAQSMRLGKRKRLALPFGLPAGRLPNRCSHIVLNPAIRRRERQDGTQRGQSAGRGRRSEPVGDQAADPSRHLSSGDQGGAYGVAGPASAPGLKPWEARPGARRATRQDEQIKALNSDRQ